MSAALEHHEACIGKRTGKRLGSLERNRVVPPMHNQHGNFYLFDALQEVEVTKTFPHLLLDATDHPERGEIVRPAGVGEVAGDGQLEGALTVGIRIPLAKSGLRELLSNPLNRRARLSLTEVGLELRAVGTCGGGGIDEDEAGRS